MTLATLRKRHALIKRVSPSRVWKKPATVTRAWLPAAAAIFAMLWRHPEPMKTRRLGLGHHVATNPDTHQLLVLLTILESMVARCEATRRGIGEERLTTPKHVPFGVRVVDESFSSFVQYFELATELHRLGKTNGWRERN